MCMNNESEILLVTAYDILQDILVLIIDRSWYVVEPENGPGILYNVVHSGVSLDTKWQTSSYSTTSLLQASRMVNEALYSVCPTQPMTPEIVSVLKSLRDKLKAMPVSTTPKSIIPLSCDTFRNDIFAKLFLLSRNTHSNWFTPLDYNAFDKDYGFFKGIFEMLIKEYGNLKHYREYLDQAWKLVSMAINMVRENCHRPTKHLHDYDCDNQPSDIISAIERECTELYPFFFLHMLERHLEALEAGNFWFLQDSLFSYFESISTECFISFLRAKSSTLSSLLSNLISRPNNSKSSLDPISRWYEDLSRFSLRRCIMLCTIFIEEISIQDTPPKELNDKITKVCPKYLINEWRYNHSTCTMISIYDQLNEILQKYCKDTLFRTTSEKAN
ncbi:Hypothetical protein GLP15_4004 [Giardia lamblia P15]|uniref:Uncharacterized protein n=1 Tax=Giardia intestinalis (strain P15) TaxID=658858 RepID=E1F8C5_GIAIA|nr:Hypothetical protein GLP15_4004 [Giardia lamblia P15]